MDFNNGLANPYNILGVPFGAPIDVCKATYKSLAKIYHPDIFVGDKDFAKKRMAELNSAYEFLADEQQKKAFDDAGEDPEQKQQSQSYEPERDNEEFSSVYQILKETWNFACEYHPELIDLHTGLLKLNRKSAFVFMANIVEQKLYHQAGDLAEYLEKEFLNAKFGSDTDLQELAKYAILRKELEFANELNKALKILGEGSKENILMKLSVSFPDFTDIAYPDLGLTSFQGEAKTDNSDFFNSDHSELINQYMKKRESNWWNF
mgnify:FL=1